MNINNEKKFLIFNNPKTGSGSLREYIKPFCLQYICSPFWSENCYTYRHITKFNLQRRKKEGHRWINNNRIHAHITPLEVKQLIEDKSESLLTLKFDDYYKISFVRNPWARIYSLFKMLQQVTKLRFADMSFDDFVNSLDIILKQNSHPVLVHTILGSKQFASDSNGNILLNHIFKLEECRYVFMPFMWNKFRIPIVEFPHRNKRTNSVDEYRLHYTDKTKNIIQKRYSWEINKFDYDF